jgi:hypothetical protein
VLYSDWTRDLEDMKRKAERLGSWQGPGIGQQCDPYDERVSLELTQRWWRPIWWPEKRATNPLSLGHCLGGVVHNRHFGPASGIIVRFTGKQHRQSAYLWNVESLGVKRGRKWSL